MTTDQLQATLGQLASIRAELEAAVAAGPQGSLRREALAMTTGWLARHSGASPTRSARPYDVRPASMGSAIQLIIAFLRPANPHG